MFAENQKPDFGQKKRRPDESPQPSMQPLLGLRNPGSVEGLDFLAVVVVRPGTIQDSGDCWLRNAGFRRNGRLAHAGFDQRFSHFLKRFGSVGRCVHAPILYTIV
jgi:hypothetical protein